MQALAERLKKQKGLPLLALLLALGIGLFVLSYCLPKEETSAAPEGAGYASLDLEQRLCAVLSVIDGVGDVRVLIHEDERDGVVVGVLVVATGAQDLGVRTELLRAAMTALDVPAEAVEVFAMQADTEGDR